MSDFAEEIVAALVRSSLQGALFIGLVWLVCRLFPGLPASIRCGLWWAACLKLLIGLVWVSPVELPLLPATETQPFHIEVVGTPNPPAINVSRVASPAPMSLNDRTLTALAALWLAGLLALAVKAARQLRHTRWVIRRSEPLDGWIRTAFAELCERLSLRRVPGLLGSEDVRTPQAIGLVRPLVVLPRAGLDKLSPPEVSMTLCHELLHLQRGDLWWGWVPALAHRIFFFHPLAAMAAREYAIAREAACDAEVIQILGSAPQAYGRLLLRWGVAPRETGLAAAGASPSLQNLKRRLQMLQSTDNDRGNKRRVSGWWWLAGVAVLAGLVPLRIVAQEPAPEAETPEIAEAVEAPEPPEIAEAPEGAPAPEAVPTPEVAPAPEAVPAPAAPGTPVPAEAVIAGVEGVPGVPATPRPPRAPGAPRAAVPAAPGTPALQALPTPRPTAAVAPAPPVPPVATPRPSRAPEAVPAVSPTARPAPAPRAHVAHGAKSMTPPPPPAPPAPPAPPKPPKKGYSYLSGGHNGDSWMLLTGDSSVMMSGDLDDLEKVKRMRGSSREDILWFRHNGKAYVVRDAATLKRAKEIFKPQMELGAKQGELGAKQGELGGKQGELGAKQGALGAEMGALAVARARRGDDADDRDVERREREIQTKQEELGRLQEELGRKQAELGRHQAELGRQQAEVSRKVEREFKGLMERTIESGVAQEVR